MSSAPNFHSYVPPCHLELLPGFRLSVHAWQRMCARGISPDAIRATLEFGRLLHIRSADYHVLGRRECARAGIAPRELDRFEGTHVLVAADGTITTVYRNRDFGRHLRTDDGIRRPRLRAA
jgi:hypothetical protein